MKTDVMPSLVKMDAEELRQLTAEVKETIARDIELGRKPAKTFSAADLWNIRRSMKTATGMMNRRG
jgi:hypothetical protein